MITTIDYINQLKIDKNNLYEYLISKGIEVSNDETFTSLISKLP